MALVSVCVPVYRGMGTIERCMRSVAEQSVAYDIELIMVNDASPDDTVAKAKLLACDLRPSLRALRIIDQPRNQGPGLTREAALSYATGDYVCFLDSDDRLDPLFVERLLSVAEQRHADVVLGQFVAAGGPRDGELMDAGAPSGPFELLVALIKGRAHGWLPGKLYRRTLIAAHPEAFSQDLTICEDLYANVVLIAHAQSVASNPSARYYYNLASDTSISTRLSDSSVASALEADERIAELLASYAQDGVEGLSAEQARYLAREVMPYRRATTKMWLLAASENWRPDLLGLYASERLSTLAELPAATRFFLRACDLGLEPVVHMGVRAVNTFAAKFRGRAALG